MARPTPAADKHVQARSISRARATTLLIAARQRSALHELLVCPLFSPPHAPAREDQLDRPTGFVEALEC